MSVGASAKAAATVKAVQKSNNGRVYTVRYETHFTNAPTLKTGRTNQLNLTGFKRRAHLDFNNCLEGLVNSEKAIRNIENNNTLVFFVNRKSNKPLIKEAVQERYNVKVNKVRTLITPRLKKKAYVTLGSSDEAMSVAKKLQIV